MSKPLQESIEPNLPVSASGNSTLSSPSAVETALNARAGDAGEMEQDDEEALA